MRSTRGAGNVGLLVDFADTWYARTDTPKNAFDKITYSKLEKELPALVERQDASPDPKRSETLESYVGALFDRLASAFLDEKTDELKTCISILRSIKDTIQVDDLMRGYVRGTLASPDWIDACRETVPILANIFDADKIKWMTPLACASAYVACENPMALEELHQEARELAIRIAQEMRPGMAVSQEVLGSL